VSPDNEKKGFIKIHILHHAAEGPIYGLQIAQELAQHGYANLSPGTLTQRCKAWKKQAI
jgi:DNA-binding PadR family transcriptional regulator